MQSCPVWAQREKMKQVKKTSTGVLWFCLVQEEGLGGILRYPMSVFSVWVWFFFFFCKSLNTFFLFNSVRVFYITAFESKIIVILSAL